MSELNEKIVGDKIAKVLARAGVASRRQAEEIVRAGRVAVDGKSVTDPAVRVAPDAAVSLDGKPLERSEETRLWRYHKPAGLVVTHRDPEGRPTVFDSLPKDMPRVISVGRLDLNSEGLLLLTNDGELARFMELPATGWKRRYRVRAHGQPPNDLVAQLAKGVTVEGVRYAPIEASIDRDQGPNIWLTIGLREGKNREVRRVLEHFGLKVGRLIRTAYGPFQLGDLARGAVETVPRRVLMDQASRFFREKGAEGSPAGSHAKPKSRGKTKTRLKARPGTKAPARPNAKRTHASRRRPA